MRIEERHYPIIILLFCALIFLPHLGILPVNIMESRNFISAREMVYDGNWILTTLNGEPRYEKPPLPTWLTAWSGMLWGFDHVGALRLPAVLMAIILTFSTYLLGKRLTGNPYYALVSALVLITSFYITWSGRNGQWDIFTHAFMMVAIYQFFLLFTSPDKTHLHALLSGLFLGLSFLSKGPVSLYALFLPFLIAFWWALRFGNTEKRRSKNRLVPLVLFVSTALVISSWWHLYIYFQDTQAATAITSKEINNWNNYNVRPFYYYWNFFIQSGVWTIIAFVGLFYPYLRNRVFHKKGYTFTLIWTLASVVLLSLIPEKKARYLLPVLIPLALNSAFYLEYLFRMTRRGVLSNWETIPFKIQFGLIGIIGILVPFGGFWYLKDTIKGNWIWFILLSISLFILGWKIIGAVRQKEAPKAFFLTLSFMVALIIFGLPLSDSLADNPEYRSMHHLEQWQDSTGLPVYEFEEFSPEMIWDYGQPIPVVKNQLDSTALGTDAFGLLAFEGSLDTIKAYFPGHQVQKIGYFDVNNRGRAQGGHKSRLYRDFYLLVRD